MVIEKTDIEDVLVVTPKVFEDERGYFFEVFNDKEFNEKTDWKYNFHTEQVNESHSTGGVFRGLHFQRDEHAQAKLVRCTEGCVVDFAVDIREDSPTFGKFEYIVLNSDNKKMFFIPKGFAHGFLVISNEATFSYLCDEGYCKESEGGIRWDDPNILTVDNSTSLMDIIDSLLDSEDEVIISEKDSKHLMLNDIYTGFNEHTLSYGYSHNEIDDQGYGIQD
jgi:dTDP-4-dehydrorhamnose 3,5-epimerase